MPRDPIIPPMTLTADELAQRLLSPALHREGSHDGDSGGNSRSNDGDGRRANEQPGGE